MKWDDRIISTKIKYINSWSNYLSRSYTHGLNSKNLKYFQRKIQLNLVFSYRKKVVKLKRTLVDCIQT